MRLVKARMLVMIGYDFNHKARAWRIAFPVETLKRNLRRMPLCWNSRICVAFSR